MQKKNKFIVFIVVILVVIIYYNYSKPIDFENTYDGIIYSFDTDFEKETKIYIDGEIYKKIFYEDKFVGNIKLDDDITYEIHLKKENNKYFQILTKASSEGCTISIGSINASSDLSKIWIQLDEIDTRYESECYVAGPANNMYEGNELAKSILWE